MQVSAVARGERAVPAPVAFVAQRVLRSVCPYEMERVAVPPESDNACVDGVVQKEVSPDHTHALLTLDLGTAIFARC